MTHKVTNLGERDYDFLWGIHTSFNGHHDYRIDIPAGIVYEEHYRSRFFDGGPIRSYDWPLLGSASDEPTSAATLGEAPRTDLDRIHTPGVH